MVATTSENTNQNEVQDAVNKIVSENLDISNIAESLKQQAKDWIEDGADDGKGNNICSRIFMTRGWSWVSWWWREGRAGAQEGDDYEKLVRLGLYGTAIGYGVSKVF
eukprot:Pgem_evm1s11330